MRIFHVVRFNHRYPDRSVVCDRCNLALRSTFFYEIYENGEKINDYPFHSKKCCREFIAGNVTFGPFDVVYVMDGNRDFFQEEETED